MKLRRNRNFTLCVEAHHFPPGLNVIAGPNGSGKSSLLECLIGQRRRSVDHVAVDGLSLGTAAERTRVYARLGYVPQSLTLPRSWVVRDYLAYAGWLKGLNASVVHDRAQALTAVLDLNPRGRIGTLSGGYARRLMIAQALMSEPRFLVLDEPSVGLDLASQDLLLELILNAATRGTVIATDHTGQLAPSADYLVNLANGRIL